MQITKVADQSLDHRAYPTFIDLLVWDNPLFAIAIWTNNKLPDVTRNLGVLNQEFQSRYALVASVECNRCIERARNI